MNVLLVEDNPGDARLIRAYLPKRMDIITTTRLSDISADVAADIILLDLSLPDSSGLDTFHRVHQTIPDTPILILSGLDDEAIAVEAVQSGAQDYLVKGSFDQVQLARAVDYAIERQKLVTQLQTLNAWKSTFLSIASHDLKSPASAIISASRLILSESTGPLNEKQRYAIDLILRNATRQVSLIQDLLNITALESGHFQLQLEQQSLAPLVRTVIVELSELALQKKIEIDCSLPEVFSRVDGARFQQIVSNLLSNALRYARSSIKITLSATLSSSILDIADDGPGISHDELPFLFDRVKKKKHSSGNTGLGLWITKGLVEAQQGSIELIASSDGAHFRVYLPG